MLNKTRCDVYNVSYAVFTRLDRTDIIRHRAHQQSRLELLIDERYGEGDPRLLGQQRSTTPTLAYPSNGH